MKKTHELARRLSGLASVLAGVLWTGGTILNLAASGTIEPATAPGAVLALAATAVMVFGFVGIYANLSRDASLLGLAGGVAGTLGAVLLSGVNTVALARSVGAVEVLRPPLEVGAPGVLALILGVLLLGFEAARDDAYSRWSGIPFILAGLLLPLRALNTELSALAIVSASVGFVWLGLRVWSGSAEGVRAGAASRATPAA